MSKMNAKKAAKLDMDDRAKISQYFSRPVGGAGDIAGNIKVDPLNFFHLKTILWNCTVDFYSQLYESA